MLPDFVIIGAQKAGSTFLLNCLAEHPDIYVHPVEDAYFQDPDYQQTPRDVFERRFEPGRGKAAVGMKRANYLASPECPQRICRDLPDVRLIAVLRDPIERAVSAYFHFMTSGFIPIQPLNHGMRQILDAKVQSKYPAAEFIIDYGLYAKHLRRYLEHFDRDRLLILLFDDLKAHPLSVVKQSYGFLAVDESYKPDRSMGTRPMASITSMPRIKLHNCARPLFIRTNPQRTRNATRRGPLGWMLRKGFNAVDRLLWARLFKGERPQLDQQIHRGLADRFRPDVGDLEKILNRRLDGWLADF